MTLKFLIFALQIRIQRKIYIYSGRTLKYPTVPHVLFLPLDITFEMYKMSESLICDKALYEVKETSTIWSKRYQRMRQR